MAVSPPGSDRGGRARVAVEQERTEVAAVDAFALYEALRAKYGPDNVVLLESLGGPAADRQSAMVGLWPALSIEVSGSRIELGGHGPLREKCLRDAVERGLLVAGDDGGYRLVEWNGLWSFLRGVRDLFDVGQSAAGFSFGFFGYFGYDIAWTLEKLPQLIEAAAPMPDMCLVVHQVVAMFDLVTGTATLTVNRGAQLPPVDEGALAEVHALLCDLPSRHEASTAASPPAPAPRRCGDSTNAADFMALVETAQEYIAIGDIYQVQLGHEIAIDTPIDPFDVYLRLRARNPSPYMYLARLAGRDVVGASPELFARVDGEAATLRPIAGTIAATGDTGADAERAQQLLADPKERAEHLMLVDLCRNDLGRVCQPGTLLVDEFMVPEHYSHVIHLVSDVVAKVRPECDAFDVLAAAFPAGTMTGAPKIRAMEIIEELETVRRGLYAGVIGLIDFSGYVNTALAIRTAVRTGSTYSLRASAGVVADSVPAKEWRETISKMNAVYWAITGEEFPVDYVGR